MLKADPTDQTAKNKLKPFAAFFRKLVQEPSRKTLLYRLKPAPNVVTLGLASEQHPPEEAPECACIIRLFIYIPTLAASSARWSGSASL